MRKNMKMVNSTENFDEYKVEKRIIIFGQYYFLSFTKNRYERQVRTVLEVLSDLGGLSKILILATTFVGNMFSKGYMYSQIINALYHTDSLGIEKFRYYDGFCGKRKSKFKRAREHIKHQLDIANFVSSINKIKAIISVIVKNNKALILKARYKYMEKFDLKSMNVGESI
jgi:hypothetical protein